MNDELKFTVISDIHYYSKKNFVDGFDKNKKPKPGSSFSAGAKKSLSTPLTVCAKMIRRTLFS